MLDAHRVTSMADTDIDAVQKRKNAERFKQYRLKRKLLTSTETELAKKRKKAEYNKQYRIKGKRIPFLTCDKYKSSLRHIHDPVLLSLKMKGIRFFIEGKETVWKSEGSRCSMEAADSSKTLTPTSTETNGFTSYCHCIFFFSLCSYKTCWLHFQCKSAFTKFRPL
jgi:hypothetical protein